MTDCIFECRDSDRACIRKTTVPLRGKLFYFLESDSCIGRALNELQLYWEEYLFSYFAHMYKNYAKDSNVLDIGANIGTSALMFFDILQESQSCGKIMSFEPIYHEILSMNLAENGASDVVQVYPFALGESYRHVDAQIYNWDERRNFGQASLDPAAPPVAHGPRDARFTVKTVDSYGFTNVGVIKIDVEGMECEVLQGALQTIRENLPIIFVELWADTMTKLKSTEAGRVLLELGYYIVQIPSPYNHDYVFVPQSKVLPEKCTEELRAYL
jgi:FkbM family methyltransferase